MFSHLLSMMRNTTLSVQQEIVMLQAEKAKRENAVRAKAANDVEQRLADMRRELVSVSEWYGAEYKKLADKV
jgi:hypothetical protein